MSTAFALLAACAGDTTAPEAPASPNAPSDPSSPSAPLGFRVLPGSVTIEINQRIRFRGELRNSRDGLRLPPMRWEASGGTITADGTFSASRAGTYKVIGRSRIHRPDTSVVIVVPRQPSVERVRVTPRTPRVVVGKKRTFTAVGRLGNGTNTAMKVNWSATGGTISPAGVFVAGDKPGTYAVIAKSLRGGLADTVPVEILTQAPQRPGAVAAKVVLQPSGVTLAPTSKHQFAAFGRTASGDSVPVEVTFEATGGTISETGLFTAGDRPGSYRVIASASSLADTATVTLVRTSGGGSPAPTDPEPGPSPLPDPTPIPNPNPDPGPTPLPGGNGVPMGIFGLLSEGVSPGAYSMAVDGYTAGNIVDRIEKARRMKIRLFLNMTGGHHRNYMTNGVFDMAKWRAKMDSYNTPAVRAAVAAAVADGTIIGNSVMDEPANVSPSNSWGPAGTMTKARVDDMCRYVKDMFPTLPVGVLHDHRIFEPEKGYQHCEFLVSQYRLSKGTVQNFRDGGVAWAKKHNMAILFSLNILHGGNPGTTCEKWGDDPRGILCAMSPSQLRDWGIYLGSAGCALMMWKYEASYIQKPEIQASLHDIASALAKLPRRSCARPA